MSRDWSGLKRLSSTAERGIKGALILKKELNFITALVATLSGGFKICKLKVVIFAG